MHWSPDSELLALVLSQPAAGSAASLPEPDEVISCSALLSHAASQYVPCNTMSLQSSTSLWQVHATSGLWVCQAEGLQQHKVQIWQRSNWHWYLKQELRNVPSRTLCIAWEPAGLILHMRSEVLHRQVWSCGC